jgi:hypothetical protein
MVFEPPYPRSPPQHLSAGCTKLKTFIPLTLRNYTKKALVRKDFAEINTARPKVFNYNFRSE